MRTRGQCACAGTVRVAEGGAHRGAEAGEGDERQGSGRAAPHQAAADTRRLVWGPLSSSAHCCHYQPYVGSAAAARGNPNVTKCRILYTLIAPRSSARGWEGGGVADKWAGAGVLVLVRVSGVASIFQRKSSLNTATQWTRVCRLALASPCVGLLARCRSRPVHRLS